MSQDFIDLFFKAISRTPQQTIMEWQAQQFVEAFFGPQKKALESLQNNLASLGSDRNELDFPVIWAMGAARLYECAPLKTSGPVLLVLPSLNQKPDEYIQKGGLIEHLIEQGIRPFLLDWGGVSAYELQMTLKDYTNKLLSPAISHLSEYSQKPINIMACQFSGPLVLDALDTSVNKLIFYAVAWDFSTEYAFVRSWLRLWGDLLCQTVENLSVVSPNLLISLLNELSPQRVSSSGFLYPMAPKVFKVILLDWIRDNILNKNQRMFENESLVIVPADDIIFSASSMMALTNCLPNSSTIKVKNGLKSLVSSHMNNNKLLENITEFLTRRT